MNLDIFNQIQAVTRENTILPTHQHKVESNLSCPSKLVPIQSTQYAPPNLYFPRKIMQIQSAQSSSNKQNVMCYWFHCTDATLPIVV